MADKAQLYVGGKALQDLRVVDLKKELEKRGLSKSGSKKELSDRLKTQLQIEKLREESSSDDGAGDAPKVDIESPNPYMEKYMKQREHLLKAAQEEKRRVQEERLRQDSQTSASETEETKTSAAEVVIASDSDTVCSQDETVSQSLDKIRTDQNDAAVVTDSTVDSSQVTQSEVIPPAKLTERSPVRTARPDSSSSTEEDEEYKTPDTSLGKKAAAIVEDKEMSPVKASPEKMSPQKLSPEKTSPQKMSPEIVSPRKTSPMIERKSAKADSSSSSSSSDEEEERKDEKEKDDETEEEEEEKLPVQEAVTEEIKMDIEVEIKRKESESSEEEEKEETKKESKMEVEEEKVTKTSKAEVEIHHAESSSSSSEEEGEDKEEKTDEKKSGWDQSKEDVPVKTDQTGSADVEMAENKENTAVAEKKTSVPKPQRKRAWGKTHRQDSIKLSTASLKNIMPDVKVTLLSSPPKEETEEEDEVKLDYDDTLSDEEVAAPKEKIMRTIEQEIPSDRRVVVSQDAESVESEAMDVVPEKRTVDLPRENGATKVTVEVKAKGASRQSSQTSLPVDDPQKIRTREASPSFNPVTDSIHVYNLTRPFTVGQLKEVLSRYGKLRSSGFWIDTIKSHCIATYETDDMALAARKSLHGTVWPSSNPKVLRVDFASKEDVAKVMADPSAAPAIPGRPHRREVEKPMRRRDVSPPVKREQQAVREWDRDKIRQSTSPAPRDRRRASREKRERSRTSRDREQKRNHERKVKEEKPKVEDEQPAKLLDDLFHKTKITPCIYWLPLTLEEAEKRVAFKVEREAEVRKRMEERENQEKETQRVRELERQKRIKEREQEMRDRSRERKNRRERRRSSRSSPSPRRRH